LAASHAAPALADRSCSLLFVAFSSDMLFDFRWLRI
jgi:hypothetical protein